MFPQCFDSPNMYVVVFCSLTLLPQFESQTVKKFLARGRLLIFTNSRFGMKFYYSELSKLVLSVSRPFFIVYSF